MGLILSELAFRFSAGQRDLFWIERTTHAGVYFEIIHLSLFTAPLRWTQTLQTHCGPPLQMFTRGGLKGDRGIQGGDGAFNNKGSENLLPGSAWTEEWAASLAESELYAVTDDESRGTPSWTRPGMFHLQSPTWTPRPVPRLPRHKRDGNFKQCR